MKRNFFKGEKMNNPQNSMKNQNGMDAFDIEAEKAGQATQTLASFQPKVFRKKTTKVRVDHFLKEKALI